MYKFYKLYSQLLFLLAPSHLSQTWNHRTLQMKEGRIQNGNIKKKHKQPMQSTKIASSQVNGFWSAPLYINVHVERSGLEALDLGRCKTRYREQEISPSSKIITNEQMLKECQKNPVTYVVFDVPRMWMWMFASN